MREKIAILIPCYNESKTIRKVIEDYKRCIPHADIYVYDNNSTDNTDIIARESGAIVKYEFKQGKGNVVRSMFREIDADCYLMIDGDDTYPAEFALGMVNSILDKSCDMAIGDRLSSTYFTENKRPFHNGGNVLVCKLVNYFFKGDVADIMTGYRAFSPGFVKSFPVLSEGFEIETEMTIHALDKNLCIKSIPVTYRDRPEGSESKLNTMRDGIRILLTIFNLFRGYKPLVFFGICSIVFLFLAILCFIPIFIEFLATGLVPKFPTLIACSFFSITSINSFTCGLILDSIVKKNRQSFEVQLNIIQMLNRQINKQ